MRSKIIAVCAVFICIAAFLAVCRTQEIDVRGNEHMEEGDVLALIEEQPLSFNTVLTVLWNRVKPLKDRGFAESITVGMSGPSSLTVTVKEKALAGCYLHGGEYWYFSADGVIASAGGPPTDPTLFGASYSPLIEGLDAALPAEGYLLPGASTGIYERIGALARALDAEKLYPDRYFLTEQQEMILTFGGVKADLGTFEEPEKAVRILAGILPETAGLEGTLYVDTSRDEDSGYIFRKD